MQQHHFLKASILKHYFSRNEVLVKRFVDLTSHVLYMACDMHHQNIYCTQLCNFQVFQDSTLPVRHGKGVNKWQKAASPYTTQSRQYTTSQTRKVRH